MQEYQFVLTVSTIDMENEMIEIIIFCTLKKITIVIFVLSILPFLPLLGGKHKCLHAKSRYKYGKALTSLVNQSGNADSGGQ